MVRGTALRLTLEDGRRIEVPLSFFPTLKAASLRDRRAVRLFGGGTALAWDGLGLELSVEGVVAGRREHVPPPGFWERLNAARPKPSKGRRNSS